MLSSLHYSELFDSQNRLVIVVPGQGLLMNILKQGFHVLFTGYRRKTDGSPGPAEAGNLIRRRGDVIIAVNDHKLVRKRGSGVVFVAVNGHKGYSYTEVLHFLRDVSSSSSEVKLTFAFTVP